ncbi:MAG: hypothetical protein ACTTJL_08715 [Hoylesella enoeca]|uniref:hypothetical protein n=1 Tax=Hoylesella enoeca TaxID=76123 RepID=UPI003FA1459A
MSQTFRRIGANRIVDDEHVLKQAVVEITHGRVTNYYTFENELPATEWLGGTILLRQDTNGVLRAYSNDIVLE